MRESYDAHNLDAQQTEDYISYVRLARETVSNSTIQASAPMVHAHKPAITGNGKFYTVASVERMESVLARFANWQAHIKVDTDTRIDMRIFLDGLHYRLEHESISLYRLIRELLAQRMRYAILFVPEGKPKRKRKTSPIATNRVLSDNGVGKRAIQRCPTVTVQWAIADVWKIKEYRLSCKRNAHKDMIGYRYPTALYSFLKKQNMTLSNVMLQFVGIDKESVYLR
jgi:hypothetical protein